MPGLNQRQEDIPLLAHHFLNKYKLLYQKEVHDISKGALQALSAYGFSGNIRELENLIERGVIFCRTDRLEAKDIFSTDNGQPSDPMAVSSGIMDLPFREARDAFMDLFYRQYIEKLLKDSNGNVSRAAESAGIQRQYLHRLIKQVGMETEDFKAMDASSD